MTISLLDSHLFRSQITDRLPPQPVQSHTLGVILVAALYLVWAWFGQLVTGHPGIFFLDPEELGGQVEAVIAACIVLISLAPGRKSRHVTSRWPTPPLLGIAC